MQHRSAHERHFAQLRIRDAGDGPGIFHDARIGHQYAGNVCPVFVYVRIHRGRGERAGDVAAAARHYLDFPGRYAAVEAGEDNFPVLFERRGDGGVSAGAVKLAVKAEEYAVGGIYEGVAERFGHEPRGEVFAAGDELIHARVARERRSIGVKFVLHAVGKAQPVADGDEPGADRGENVGAGDAVGQMRVAEIEKIGELVIVARALSGGRDDDDAARRIGENDIAHLAELLCPCDGRAAEFAYFQHSSSSSAAKNRSFPSLRMFCASACIFSALIGSVTARTTSPCASTDRSGSRTAAKPPVRM